MSDCGIQVCSPERSAVNPACQQVSFHQFVVHALYDHMKSLRPAQSQTKITGQAAVDVKVPISEISRQY